MTSSEKVLQYLKKNSGNYCSGQKMAEDLGISRNSVWKAVRKLKAEGHEVSAVTNRGYMLKEELPADTHISAEKVISFLDPGSKNFHIRVYETIGSTNREAKKMAVEGAPDGTVLIAESQSMGRGHGAHSFFSPKGGIYMSVLMRPDKRKWDSGELPHEDRMNTEQTAKGSRMSSAQGTQESRTSSAQSTQESRTSSAQSTQESRTSSAQGTRENGMFTEQITRKIAEAVKKTTGLPVTVRPVNDLYLDGKKVGGILTEAGVDADTGEIDWLVVGIGINYRTETEDFPEEIRERAGSLYPGGTAGFAGGRLPGRSENGTKRDAEPVSGEQLIAEILKGLYKAE